MIKKIDDSDSKEGEDTYPVNLSVRTTKKAYAILKEAVPYVRADLDAVGVPDVNITMSATIEWVVGMYVAEKKKAEEGG